MSRAKKDTYELLCNPPASPGSKENSVHKDRLNMTSQENSSGTPWRVIPVSVDDSHLATRGLAQQRSFHENVINIPMELSAPLEEDGTIRGNNDDDDEVQIVNVVPFTGRLSLGGISNGSHNKMAAVHGDSTTSPANITRRLSMNATQGRNQFGTGANNQPIGARDTNSRKNSTGPTKPADTDPIPTGFGRGAYGRNDPPPHILAASSAKGRFGNQGSRGFARGRSEQTFNTPGMRGPPSHTPRGFGEGQAAHSKENPAPAASDFGNYSSFGGGGGTRGFGGNKATGDSGGGSFVNSGFGNNGFGGGGGGGGGFGGNVNAAPSESTTSKNLGGGGGGGLGGGNNDNPVNVQQQGEFAGFGNQGFGGGGGGGGGFSNNEGGGGKGGFGGDSDQPRGGRGDGYRGGQGGGRGDGGEFSGGFNNRKRNFQDYDNPSDGGGTFKRGNWNQGDRGESITELRNLYRALEQKMDAIVKQNTEILDLLRNRK